MANLKYKPISHDHKTFLKKARKCAGFCKAYDDLEKEYTLVHEMLLARSRSGLTQEAVAELMGTTKSAVSRLESAGKHAPSLTTLKKYAEAVGCNLEIKLVPRHRATNKSTGRNGKLHAGQRAYSGQTLRIIDLGAAARPHHGSNPARIRCHGWNGFSGRDVIRRQDLFAVSNRKNGNLLFFYPVNDPVVGIYQLPDFPMVGFRHDSSDIGKRLQLFDFDKYLIDPAFCGSWIIPGYVFRDLGQPVYRERRPDDSHFPIRFKTDALASPCSMPCPPSNWLIDVCMS